MLVGRVGRIERLLDDLLKYSRAGRVTTDITTVDTNELLQSTTVLFDLAQYKFLVSDDMPVIDTEAIPLETCFRHLIGNALMHHDKEAGEIHIGWTDLGEMYEFSVSDDGPGIAPEYHEKIFRVFQTLKPRSELEASGIGLALVKKLAEGYGGSVRIESQLGKGATFFFTWPKKIAPRNTATGV